MGRCRPCPVDAHGRPEGACNPGANPVGFASAVFCSSCHPGQRAKARVSRDPGQARAERRSRICSPCGPLSGMTGRRGERGAQSGMTPKKFCARGGAGRILWDMANLCDQIRALTCRSPRRRPGSRTATLRCASSLGPGLRRDARQERAAAHRTPLRRAGFIPP